MTTTRAKIQDDRMIPILQQSVNTELTVSQHYWGRAVFWRNLGVEKLAEMYQKEAEEERGHAQMAADRMAFLGAQPRLAPTEERPASGSLRRQFEEDLAGEVAVANQYSVWVAEALSRQDFSTMDVLKKILLETEEHVDKLQGELAVADQLGDELFLARWAG